VQRTGVDALAIAMGTSHGAYKFTRKPDGDVLAMNVIEEIHQRLPNTHLVMHGSSSVPQDLQDIINQYGGAIPQTWGVPVEEIQRGIKHGVRKVNVDTDNRLAITGAIRKMLMEKPRSTVWLSIGTPASMISGAGGAGRRGQFADVVGVQGHIDRLAAGLQRLDHLVGDRRRDRRPARGCGSARPSHGRWPPAARPGRAAGAATAPADRRR
jgi:hypothetical protein